MLRICVYIVAINLLFSCKKSSEASLNSKIPVFMEKNLSTIKFRNGDSIPQVQDSLGWKLADSLKLPAWCYYGKDSTNDIIYGKLYNWYAVNDSRGLAPEGYHIPKKDEWIRYFQSLGGELFAGEKMKDSTGWFLDSNGTNESGFKGLPGGYRYYSGGFNFILKSANFWCLDDYNDNKAWMINLYFADKKVNYINFLKGNGYSVRCVKD